MLGLAIYIIAVIIIATILHKMLCKKKKTIDK